MPSTTAQSLRRATASTFESLAFLFLEAECSEAQAAAPLDAAVSVDFHGPVRGRLTLRVSSSLLPVIAANMLGEEQSRQVPLQRDALGEVANVVCGNALPLIAGADAVFRLDAPRWMADEAVARDGDAPAATVLAGAEDGRVQAVLFLFGDADALETLGADANALAGA
jgi:CheY-specific phosphatase CheX